MAIFLGAIYMPVQTVFAAMVQTEAVMGDQSLNSAREKVRAFLQRQDVQAAIAAQGIDPLEAQTRVDSLSDAEVNEIAARIDQLPAAGGALGTVLVILLAFFLVLLILDMIGVTDIFTFINPPKK
jgi:hypothetical protein